MIEYAEMLIGIILIVISFILRTCSSPNVKGGSYVKWFDPQVFVNMWNDKLWISPGTDAATASWEPVDKKNWQAQVQRNDRDGVLIADENKSQIMKLVNWQKLPNDGRTRYLREYKADISALKGENSFLMTPFLRTWQRRNMWKFIPERANLFDIGVGTGRSRDLWKAKQLRVWGVEPNKESVETLQNRNLQMLVGKDGNSHLWPYGGEDKRIREVVPEHEMDIVMMSYSITFFFENDKKLNALVENIKHSLKKGGRFILIGMDGSHVDQWFETAKTKKGEALDNSLFTLVKKYSKITGPFGNKVEISIKNPNTLVTAQSEYLVDFDHFRKVLSHAGLKCEHDEHVKPEGFLAEWPAKWVAAQRFLVFC